MLFYVNLGYYKLYPKLLYVIIGYMLSYYKFFVLCYYKLFYLKV